MIIDVTMYNIYAIYKDYVVVCVYYSRCLAGLCMIYTFTYRHDINDMPCTIFDVMYMSYRI